MNLSFSARWASLAWIPLVIALLLFSGIQTVYAASYDPGFGMDGFVTVTADPVLDHLQNGIVVQPDGKTIIAGSIESRPSLTRLNDDGTVDTSFGVNGFFIYDPDTSFGFFRSVTLSGSSIVAVGAYNTHATVVRLTASGALDTTFNSTGVVTRDTGANSAYYEALVMPDGRIITFGTSSGNWIGARYNANGTLDNTFGTGGLVSFNPAPAAIGPNPQRGMVFDTVSDKFYVLGEVVDVAFSSVYALARFNPDGSLDSSFGTNGFVQEKFVPTTSFNVPSGMHVLGNGRILLAGDYGNYGVAIVRLNTSGTRDTNFGTGGLIQIEEATFPIISNSFAVDNNGKLLVATYAYGSAQRFNIIHRRNANGSPDTTFNSNGKLQISLAPSVGAVHTWVVDHLGRYVGVGNIRDNDDDVTAEIVAMRLLQPPTERPTAPVLVTPGEGAEFVGELPQFVWNANPSYEQVTTYRLSVLDKKGVVLKNVQIPADTCAATCVFNADDLGITFKKGDHSWRVRATNAVGNRNSATGTFTLDVPGAPTNLSPDGLYVSPEGVGFTWTLQGNPEEFRITVLDNKGERLYRSSWEPVGGGLGCSNSGDTCTYILERNFSNSSFSWFVQARNRTLFAGNSKSASATFFVSFPDVPNAQNPINGTVVQNPAPQFFWVESINATEYRVQVRHATTRAQVYNSGWGADVVCGMGICYHEMVSNIPNGSYEWRVQARNSTFPNQTNSGWQAFSVSSPGVATNLSGMLNSGVEWTSAPYATEYRIQVRLLSDNSKVFTGNWFPCDALTCNDNLGGLVLITDTYRWRVQARNANGRTNSAWLEETIP